MSDQRARRRSHADANAVRERILFATAEVLGRSGMSKLNLTQVALGAGVSRPTLYRWFSTKEQLLNDFVEWERSFYEQAISRAIAGLTQPERLDAALQVIVNYQHSYPGMRMVDIEPGQVIARLSRVLPLMRDRLERLSTRSDSAISAATAVRVAVSHYLVSSDDDGDFLAQLRHSVRLKGPTRGGRQ